MIERGVLLRCAPNAKGDELRAFSGRRLAVPLPEDFGSFGDLASEVRLAGEVVTLGYMSDELDDSQVVLVEKTFVCRPLAECFDAPGAYLVEGFPEDYRPGVSPVDAHGRRLWWAAILEGAMAAVARRIVANMRGLVDPDLPVAISDQLKHLLIVSAGAMTRIEELRAMVARLFCWNEARIDRAIAAGRGD
jgi:hypothetical protein